MPRELEIERKFLVQRLPGGWKHRASSPIVQGYFPMANGDLEIRLRRKGAQHFITIKAGHGRRRPEKEIPIRKSTFQALWPLTGTARISKRRYKIPWRTGTIEMDVYSKPHRELMTTNIEFPSMHESQAFDPPN